MTLRRDYEEDNTHGILYSWQDEELWVTSNTNQGFEPSETCKMFVEDLVLILRDHGYEIKEPSDEN